MRSVTDFIKQLEEKYGSINFKKICESENIVYAKGRLPENVKGFYLSSNGNRVIVIDDRLSKSERRDKGMHELWHALQSPALSSTHASEKENVKADLFAALVRIPEIKFGDTIESIVERHDVSATLATLRIEHEKRKLARQA